MVRPNATARAILDSLKFIAIATVGEDGQPWNTIVAPFHFPGEYIYYWISWQENQHSKNIAANRKAFAVAYDSTPDGGAVNNAVYMLVDAQPVDDTQEVAKVAAAIGIGPSQEPQLLGQDARRLYKIVPNKIWTDGDDEIDGNHIDIRLPAEEA